MAMAHGLHLLVLITLKHDFDFWAGTCTKLPLTPGLSMPNVYLPNLVKIILKHYYGKGN